MKRFKIRLQERNELGIELHFIFNDRFQAVSFKPFEKKQDVVRLLRELANNIEHDDKIE